MKRLTFNHHKKVLTLCEEGLITTEESNALLMPQSTKQTSLPKTQGNIGTINKFCTNYGMTNHNVETCIKEQTTMATTRVAQQSKKLQKTSSYACHIYGLKGHKMTDCPKFIQMQKLFHGKFVTITKVQPFVETKIITIDVNVVDVNATTRGKATEEQMFKDRNLMKAKSVLLGEKKG